jgi:ATP-binding cassette, subfamily B, bacterial MsbA
VELSGSPERFSDLKRLLMETGRRYAWLYALAFVLLGIVSATTAATAWLMKDVINDVFIAKNQSALIYVSAAVLVIYLLRGLSSYGQGVILSRIGNSIVANAQGVLIAKLLAEDVGRVLARTSTEIVQKQGFAAGSLRNLLQVLITVVGRDILTLIGLVFVMIVQDPLVSSVVLISLPIAAFLIGNLGQRMRAITHRSLTIGVAMSDQLRQVIQGFKVVRAFGMEEKTTQTLLENIDEQRKNADKAAALQARTQPVVETLAGIAISLVILYGGWRVMAHGHTPGEFFSFITALLLAYDPARRLAGARVQIDQGLVGLRMYFEMIDHTPTLLDPPAAPALACSTGEVRFEGVSFAYEDGSQVLTDIAFSAKAGQITALVGASGSGKSTLLSLLLRFWQPQEGRILIDDQDISMVQAASLRAAIAYVGQDAFLFDSSVRENIRVGRPDASDREVEQAARNAQAHDFILDLPQGYETRLGELASRLSGGQKSRIAIARAFLRDAPILLLDEPTAALDSASEEAIRTTLNALQKGRTTIQIAHRLASISGADQIIVVDAGQIVERGTHRELLALGGFYARLQRLQGHRD